MISQYFVEFNIPATIQWHYNDKTPKRSQTEPAKVETVKKKNMLKEWERTVDRAPKVVFGLMWTIVGADARKKKADFRNSKGWMLSKQFCFSKSVTFLGYYPRPTTSYGTLCWQPSAPHWWPSHVPSQFHRWPPSVTMTHFVVTRGGPPVGKILPQNVSYWKNPVIRSKTTKNHWNKI